MFPQDGGATLPTPARPRSCPPSTKICSNMTATPRVRQSAMYMEAHLLTSVQTSSQDIASIRDKNVERTAGSPIIPQLALHEPCSVIIENVDSTSLYESPADEVLITRDDSTRSESQREGPRKVSFLTLPAHCRFSQMHAYRRKQLPKMRRSTACESTRSVQDGRNSLT